MKIETRVYTDRSSDVYSRKNKRKTAMESTLKNQNNLIDFKPLDTERKIEQKSLGQYSLIDFKSLDTERKIEQKSLGRYTTYPSVPSSVIPPTLKKVKEKKRSSGNLYIYDGDITSLKYLPTREKHFTQSYLNYEKELPHEDGKGIFELHGTDRRTPNISKNVLYNAPQARLYKHEYASTPPVAKTPLQGEKIYSRDASLLFPLNKETVMPAIISNKKTRQLPIATFGVKETIPSNTIPKGILKKPSNSREKQFRISEANAGVKSKNIRFNEEVSFKRYKITVDESGVLSKGRLLNDIFKETLIDGAKPYPRRIYSSFGTSTDATEVSTNTFLDSGVFANRNEGRIDWNLYDTSEQEMKFL